MSEMESQSQAPADAMPEGLEELAAADDAAFVADVERPSRNVPLVILGILILGAGAIYLMHMKAGPRAAQASTEAVTAKATIDEFLNDGGKNLSAMRDLLKNTEKVIQQFAEYPSMTQVAVEDLKTNPFRMLAPQPAADDSAAAAARRLEEEKKKVMAELPSLQLQSIIHSGSVATCMISNRMLKEGDEINGFVIEKVNPDSVIVRKSRWRFSLSMKR